MNEMIESVKTYYDADPQIEWHRTNIDTIEYKITTKILSRYIHTGDEVLDIGGGPGRYALWLAAGGCDVTLFDLSEANVAFAERKARNLSLPIRTICGNALEQVLYPDHLYDHILVMGPMYHLFNEADRRKVIDNALKHLKPGGKIYIAFINLFAGMMYYLDVCLDGLLEEEASSSGYVDCVVADRGWQGKAFTEARFESLLDIRRFCSGFGLKQVTVFGQEGFLGSQINRVQTLPEPHRSLWIDCAAKMCELPDYLIMSAHIMYIGEK